MDIYFRDHIPLIFKLFYRKSGIKLNICINYKNLKGKIIDKLEECKGYCDKIMLDPGTANIQVNTDVLIIDKLRNRYLNFIGSEFSNIKKYFTYVLSFCYNQNYHFEENLELIEQQKEIYDEIVPQIFSTKFELEALEEYKTLNSKTYAILHNYDNTFDEIYKQLKAKSSIHILNVDDFSYLNDLKYTSFDTNLWIRDSKKHIVNLLVKDDGLVYKKITFGDIPESFINGIVSSRNEDMVKELFADAKNIFNIEFEDFYNSEREETFMIMNLYQIYKFNQLINRMNKEFSTD